MSHCIRHCTDGPKDSWRLIKRCDSRRRPLIGGLQLERGLPPTPPKNVARPTLDVGTTVPWLRSMKRSGPSLTAELPHAMFCQREHSGGRVTRSGRARHDLDMGCIEVHRVVDGIPAERLGKSRVPTQAPDA